MSTPTEPKLVSALADTLVSFGLKPPAYKRPKWYQLKLKQRLAYYDKKNWPYTLEAKH